MKTTLGGNRLGSGNKQDISMRNYERSSHDLSYVWRSSMSSGTLVPFMSQVALPGDRMDIDLNAHVLTLPTVGPLFGSYKVQMDVFKIPIRLYNAKLHMNMLGIGLNMSSIKLPQFGVKALKGEKNKIDINADNGQIGSSCILKYFGISGVGAIEEETESTETRVLKRNFNAVPLLAYWDIYKNYYANKQEKEAYVVHTGQNSVLGRNTTIGAYVILANRTKKDIYEKVTTGTSLTGASLVYVFGDEALEPDPDKLTYLSSSSTRFASENFDNVEWIPKGKGEGRRTKEQNVLVFSNYVGTDVNPTMRVNEQTPIPKDVQNLPITLQKFPLDDIDKMKMEILSDIKTAGAFQVDETELLPYAYLNEVYEVAETKYLSITSSQEGLGIKTYQSDLFNNWVDTEWIDGTNGINEITSVDTTGDSFTIDALNLASKVYVMLNRIAVSGGSYDDWLEAVYTNERKRSTESPVYLGGLIKELTFEEVVSNAETEDHPLGTIAGRGTLTGKHKGGKIRVEVDEPSYIMGIVSLTPRIDYSQGNKWDMNLESIDDLHKPALDAIGFQDLITEQMHWAGTTMYIPDEGEPTLTYKSAGKQPAWINYMTEVNRTYGNFAESGKEMFMTLNRRYELEETEEDGIQIKDITTYIDPEKYNNIFADTNLDAQNFWVQIGVNNTARRKMSAKIIPNL